MHTNFNFIIRGSSREPIGSEPPAQARSAFWLGAIILAAVMAGFGVSSNSTQGVLSVSSRPPAPPAVPSRRALALRHITRQTTTSLFTFTAGSQPGWQLVSSPDTIPQQFSSLGIYAAAYSPSTGAYVVTPTAPADTFHLGQGYWIYLTQTVSIPSPGSTADQTQSAFIPLQKGWNMIGDPFTSAISLSQLKVTQGNSSAPFVTVLNNQAVSPLYTYDPTSGQYTALTTSTQSLSPWAGAWVFSTATATLVVAPPSGTTTGGTATGTVTTGTPTGTTTGATTSGTTGTTTTTTTSSTTGTTTGATTSGTAATTGTTTGPSSIPRTHKAQWTILGYINAANNLEPFSVENVDQMEKATYSTDVNVVLQWKRSHIEAAISDDHIFDSQAAVWDGTRRFWLTGRTASNGGFNADEIQDLGSGEANTNPTTPDMGDWHTLQAFIQWGQQNFPAQHYLVLIWNHGAGWEHRSRAFTRAVPHRGISYDDASNDAIETWQLPGALTGTAPLDIVAMDASLMQMAEVVYEMRNSATYIVGSEDSPPGDGYPYQLWVPPLTATPTMTPLQLADLITDTHASYWATQIGDNGAPPTAVTQSTVVTANMAPVASALDNLGSVLYANRTQAAAAFATARTAAHIYGVHPQEPIYYPEYKDLVEYCNLLETNAGGVSGLNAACEAVKKAVVGAAQDNRAVGTDSFSNGLSIYVPVPLGVVDASGQPAIAPQSYDPLFTQLDIASAAPNWTKFIQNQVQ